MRAAIIALVLIVAPLRVTLPGAPVSFPAGWLILAAEVLAAAATGWLAVRFARGFRSSPNPRTAFWPGGAP
jgi:hypothetical protein